MFHLAVGMQIIVFVALVYIFASYPIMDPIIMVMIYLRCMFLIQTPTDNTFRCVYIFFPCRHTSAFVFAMKFLVTILTCLTAAYSQSITIHSPSVGDVRTVNVSAAHSALVGVHFLHFRVNFQLTPFCI